MGFLKPISKYDRRTGGMSLTADKFERICLSKELQKEIGLEKNMPLYLYFDEDERRIGIAKQGVDKEHQPYTFDKRGYATASDFMDRCGIDTSEQSIKFLYEGTEKGVMVFRQVGIRKRHDFVQEKNGNIERVG